MESIYKLEKVLVLKTGNRLKFFFIQSFLVTTYWGKKKGAIKFIEEVLI